MDLRTGILGYGVGGRVFHAPLVDATAGMTVAAIVTADPRRAAQAAADYPGAVVLPDADALFARAADLDLVVVSTPNRTHGPLALRAIAAGVPVVVDKPFAPAVAEALRVRAAARRAGVAVTVFQNRRWDSDFRTVRAVLAAGRLGEVYRFESRFDRWRPELKPGWRETTDPADAGGLLYDLGSHLIDQALQLFGPVRTVYAETDRRRPGALVDDDSFVALHHASGVRSHLWTSALAATRNPRFRVLGDRGTFTKYGLDVQESQARDGGRPGDPGWGVEPESAAGTLGADADTVVVPTETGCYQQFYAQLRDALHGTAELPVTPESAVDVLAVIEAAHASAAQHRVITVQGWQIDGMSAQGM